MIKFRIPVHLWRGATIAYMALLMYVSLIPKVIPGPSTPLKENIHNSLHIPAYAVLTFFIWQSFRRWSLMRIAVLAFSYGVLNELLQMLCPDRTASMADAGRNSIGIALMIILIVYWQKRQNKTGGLK